MKTYDYLWNLYLKEVATHRLQAAICVWMNNISTCRWCYSFFKIFTKNAHGKKEGISEKFLRHTKRNTNTKFDDFNRLKSGIVYTHNTNLTQTKVTATNQNVWIKFTILTYGLSITTATTKIIRERQHL